MALSETEVMDVGMIISVAAIKVPLDKEPYNTYEASWENVEV